MASTQIQTITTSGPFTNGRCIVVAGSRVYAIFGDGSNLIYRYSDDNMATWSTETTIRTGNWKCSAFYDSTNGRLNFAYALGNSDLGALYFRAITSNVTSGTPGSMTAEQTLDAGGANAGVNWVYAVHTDTATRPRYWIGAMKITAASTYETRLWYATAGTSADTAANWTTLSNVMSRSDSNAAKNPVMQWWTIAGAEKLTVLAFKSDAVADLDAVTFDPTATTPAVGTVTNGLMALGSGATDDFFAQGPQLAINGKADLLVFGRHDFTAGTWGYYSSTNGTSWTALTSGSVTQGRAVIAKSGGDFYVVAESSYSSTPVALEYRKITASTTTLGSATTFSDTNGVVSTVPLDTGTSNLIAMYRGTSGSPYSLRTDSLSLSAGGGGGGGHINRLLVGAG